MAQLNFSIPDALLAKLDAAKPDYLDRKGFLCLLIDEALTGVLKVPAYCVGAGTQEGLPMQNLSAKQVQHLSHAQKQVPPANEEAVALGPKKKPNKRKGRNEGKKRDPYPDDFEQFWRSYQCLPQKASKQSKPLAHDAWVAACTDHAPVDLQRAVERQLEIQRDELNSDRPFTVAMPDCFRWLRDECFVALLEDHAPAQSKPSYLW